MLVKQFAHKMSCIIALAVLSTSVLAYEAPVESRTESPNPPSQASQMSSYGQPYVDESSLSFQPINSSDNGAIPTQQSVYADDEPKSQMLDKIAHLEQDVRELRGLVEEQGYSIKRLEKLIALSNRDNALTAKPSLATPAMNSDPNVTQENPDVSSSKSSSSDLKPTESANEQKSYQDAFSLLRNKQFTQAAQAMGTYLKTYPNGQYAVNAHYWLGELSLIQGDDKVAYDQFSQLVKKFPSSPKVPDAMLKIGTIYADQKKWPDAKSQFKNILNQFPESSAAKLADQRLQQIELAGH